MAIEAYMPELEAPEVEKKKSAKQISEEELRKKAEFNFDLAKVLSEQGKDYIKAWYALDEALSLADQSHMPKEFSTKVILLMNEINKNITPEDLEEAKRREEWEDIKI